MSDPPTFSEAHRPDWEADANPPDRTSMGTRSGPLFLRGVLGFGGMALYFVAGQAPADELAAD